MRYLIFIAALVSCGYHSGDLDHALSCETGCPAPSPNASESTSCTVESVSNGAIITCPNGTSSVILNGTPGNPGVDGQPGKNGIDGLPGKDSPVSSPTAIPVSATYTFTETVDPCGAQGSFDEVLFKTEAGPFVAFYSGSGGFLTVLHDGDYVTSDGTHCYFTILNNEITNEHN